MDRRFGAQPARTGHARPEDPLLALMGGFQLHLAKPVEPILLVRALAALDGRD